MEVILLNSISDGTVAKSCYSNWVSRFGAPSRLITDRGTQFKPETLQSLSNIFGIKLQHTTAYHTLSIGKIKRLHRSS